MRNGLTKASRWETAIKYTRRRAAHRLNDSRRIARSSNIHFSNFPEVANRRVKAVRAKVRIAGRETESRVETETTGVVFELDLPEGKTELQTWLFDGNGAAGGAYFTEVELLSSADVRR